MDRSIAGLGDIMQIAFVPRDVKGSLNFWTEVIGAGPFYSLPHIAYKQVTYRGRPSKIDFSVYIGYWGDLQIELIEQHCDSPSIYKAWLDAGLEGIQHVCLIVDSIAHAREVCAAAGATVEQEVFLEGGEAIYLDTGGGPGTMVEILEPMPGFADLCAMMREAHRGWDGGDPVRGLS